MRQPRDGEDEDEDEDDAESADRIIVTCSRE